MLVNMYVLYHYSSHVCIPLGKEQAVCLYLTAGCVASFASYMNTVVTGIGGAAFGAVSFIFWTICFNRFKSKQ